MALYDFLSQDERQPGRLCFGGARMVLLDVESGFWALRRQIEALVGHRIADGILQQAGVNGGASFARAFVDSTSAENGAQAFRDCLAAYQAAGFGQFEIEIMEWPVGRIVVRGTDTFEAWMARQHGQETHTACAYTAGVLVGFVNIVGDRRDIVCVRHTCQAQGASQCSFELLPSTQSNDASVVTFDPDPFLSQQLNLLEVLFDRTPMGIAILDRDLMLRRCNPTWAELIHRSTQIPASQVVAGSHLLDLVPSGEPHLRPALERALAGESVYLEGFCPDVSKISFCWDVFLTPLIEDGKVTGVVGIIIDATQRMRFRQELEQTLKTLQESESSLRSLLESAKGFVVYRVAVAPDNPHKGRVVLVSPSIVEMLGLEDPYDFASWFSNIHPDDLARVVEANQRSLETGVQYDESMRWYHPRRKEWIWLRMISNPLLDEEGKAVHFNGLVLDITGMVQAQQTLEAAHQILERRVEERTREAERRRRVAEGLRGILAVLNSSLSLEETLRYVVTQSNQLLGSDAALIYRFDAAREWMVMESEVGLPPDYQALRAGPVYATTITRAALNRQPATIPDLPAYVASEIAHNRAHLTDFHLRWFEVASEHFYSTLGVSIVIREELYGGLVFYYRDRHEFSEEDLQLAISLGDQAALAIENARLHAQVEEVAVIRERERLARELHDSVTQSLYSVTLLAEAGQRLAGNGDVEHVQGYLERLGDISQQALKEMRLLVYELRPLALRRDGLVGALQQRLDAVEKRAGIDARLLVDGEISLSGSVEETLYRVAQEALNNALKHATPTAVTVHIRSGKGQVELEVTDDGKGFDPQATGDTGGMGLDNMRQRVEELGGQFSLLSAPGEGTKIRVVMEVPN